MSFAQQPVVTPVWDNSVMELPTGVQDFLMEEKFLNGWEEHH
jgi:hypothetical protein